MSSAVRSKPFVGTPLEMLDRQIIPADAFFERSHHGTPIEYAPLTLCGTEVDLSHHASASVTAVLQCAGNGRALFEPPVPGLAWAFGGIAQGTWTGVRLCDVLGEARPAHVWFASADGRYRSSLPIAKALEPTTLLATHLNGAPLRRESGGPLRVVVPSWTGNHWMKWLTEITFADEAFVDGEYQVDGEPVTMLPVKSLIARPADGGVLSPGAHEVVGVAFSGAHEIAKVHVALDGEWSVAETDGASAPGRWTVFRLRIDLTVGRHHIAARAEDTSGAVQPARSKWNSGGYLHNAWHRLAIDVA